MMKIGEFSQLSRVTIKTLRYYDKIGLFEPECIDPDNGHRYYSLTQLSDLNRILALKALGLSLDQIQDVLSNDLTDNQLITMFAIKKAELLQTLSDVQKQIERLDTRIQYVMQEGKMPEYEVVLKSVKPQRVLSLRERIADGSMIEPLLQEIYNTLRDQDIESVGDWMTLYHHNGFRPDNLDVEVAIPIGNLDLSEVKISQDRVMTVRMIDGHDTVATVIEQGNKETWDGSYLALSNWLQNNDYEPILPTREVYLTDDKDQGKWLVEIQYPVKKVMTSTK